MLSPAIYFSNGYNRPVIYDYTGTQSVRISITTYSNNYTVVWGDGSRSAINPSKQVDFTNTSTTPPVANKTYSALYTGSVKMYFRLGISDVYSVRLDGSQNVPDAERATFNKFNIQDLGAFLRQFPKLYSIHYSLYAYAVLANRVTVKGNLLDIPKPTKRVMVSNIDVTDRTTNVTTNFNSLTPEHQLEYYRHEGVSGATVYNTVRILGDIANLPVTLQYFYHNAPFGTIALTYTSGKIWRANFDTFHLNLNLSTAIIDSMLIDMAASITSAVGAKVIFLRGTRSAASNAAFNYLQNTLGFSITITA